MYKKAGLLYLADRRSLNQCSLLLLISTSLIILNLIIANVVPYVLVIVLRAWNRCFVNSFVLKSINKWNSLSDHFKMIPCYETKLFKTRVKKEMIGNKLNFPE